MRIHIATFLILISCLNVFSKASAQKINLQLKQVELETVFKAIERQVDYGFAYGVSLLANSEPITVELKNVTLTEALDYIFKDLPYKYEIISKTIVIKAKTVTNKQPIPENLKPIKIRGKVTDKNLTPLIGVSVRLRGTNIGTVTDQLGNYQIEGDSEGTLDFTFVGFQARQIKINNQTEINQTLIEYTSELKETVVKGYYTTTKEFNTGTVSSVDSKILERQPVGDPILALQAQVPGLFVSQTSGIPGAGLNVMIRGKNSIGNGTAPMYIVDGVPFASSTLSLISSSAGTISPLSTLRLNDIESIEVLKDADATAIYGSRGANGVILINTKKGKIGSTSLSASIYQGAGKIASKMKLMKTEQYLAMRKEAFAYDNATPGTTDYDLNGAWPQDKSTDWQDVLIGGTAKLTDAQVSLGGGNEQTQFLLGTGYRRETTVFPGDYKNQKVSAHLSLKHQSSNRRFNAAINVSYLKDDNSIPYNDFTSQITLAPNTPDIYKADGTFNWQNSTWSNPLAATLRSSTFLTDNLITGINIGYNLFDGFTLSTRMGYTDIKSEQVAVSPFAAFDPSFNPLNLRMRDYGDNRVKSWIIEPVASYSKFILGGKWDALVGLTFQEDEKYGKTYRATGFSSDAVINNISAASTISVLANSESQYKYTAVYGRVGYNLREKYILNITGRRDGSSRFGPGHRFGNFGAIGAAWIFSKEKFVNEGVPFLSFGKVRASYGLTGNDQFPDYKYYSTYLAVSSNYQGLVGITPRQHTNPNYRWETVKKLELGLELGFFKDNLLIAGNFYRNRTGNQLVGYSLPDYTGFPNVQANLPAVLQNSGFEVEINSTNLKKAGFTWSTSFNINVPKSKLVSYPNLAGSSYTNQYVVGEPLFLSFRYVYSGKDETTGLHTFEDLNKDGQISFSQDRRAYFLGQKYFGGISNSFTYKGLQLDFTFQFVKQTGSEYLPSYPGVFAFMNPNFPVSYLDNGERQPFSQKTNSAAGMAYGFYQDSDATVGDASYVRLKNIALSWDFPSKLIERCKLNQLRLFMQAQNLFTLSGYKGLEPDLQSFSGLGLLRLPPIKYLTLGIQLKL